MLVCHWQNILCNTCKDISNDFASHSFVGWLSLGIVSSAVIYQSAFCVILIHMLISVVKSIILAFWTFLHLAIWEYLSASAREVCTLQVLPADFTTDNCDLQSRLKNLYMCCTLFFLPEMVVHVMIQSSWGIMISIGQGGLRSLSACLKTLIAVAWPHCTVGNNQWIMICMSQGGLRSLSAGFKTLIAVAWSCCSAGVFGTVWE